MFGKSDEDSTPQKQEPEKSKRKDPFMNEFKIESEVEQLKKIREQMGGKSWAKLNDRGTICLIPGENLD